jgi:drug/metabolite transporter (DMT)-like permease
LFVRAAHADPWAFTTWRLWFALPPLTLLVLWRKRTKPEASLWPAGIATCRVILTLGVGGAFFAASASTAFAAIGMTRLLDVTLIMSLQPVLIAMFAVAALREAVSARYWGIALVAIAGTALVAGTGTSSGSWSLAGELVAVLSLVLNAGWFLYGRVLRSRMVVDPFVLLLGVFAAAAVLLTPVAAVTSNGLSLSAGAIGYAACTMVSGTTAHALMIWAHRYMPASASAPLLLAEPAIVGLGAWWWFGQALTPVAIIGSAVVLAALAGMSRNPTLGHEQELSPDPLAAA